MTRTASSHSPIFLLPSLTFLFTYDSSSFSHRDSARVAYGYHSVQTDRLKLGGFYFVK